MAIDGLISGLDTSSIIQQLMSVEKAPQDALVSRKATVQAALDALGSIRTKLGGLSSAAATISSPSGWGLRSATTTSSSTAVVSAAKGASIGSLTFTVDRLASAHGLRSTDVFATTATTAAAGPLTFTGDDGPVSVSVGSGSLADVVAGINAADLGVRAAAVNTGAGYRLQVTATTTGDGSTFTLAGLTGGTTVTSTGQDAKLVVGSGPGAYDVTSPSNTFSDVLSGVSITAVAVSASPVTVDVAEDVDGMAKQVQSFVDSLNAVLGEIKTRTAYDAATKTAASLNGDPTVRRVAQELIRAVTDQVGASSLGSAGLAGLQITRNGTFTFDSAKFGAAYRDDPDAVQALFTQTATTTGPVTFRGAGNRALSGTYDVVVTSPATAASASQSIPDPLVADRTISVRVNGTVASFDAVAGQDLATISAGLAAAIADEGLQLDVGIDAGQLVVTHRNAGSAARFDVAWDGATWTTAAGSDVAGTIGGKAAVGTGRVLAVPSATAGLGGLSVTVGGSGTGVVGTVDYTAGLAQRVASAAAAATDLGDGYLTGEETSTRSRISSLQSSISAWDVRLTAKEAHLRAVWSQLEVQMGSLQSQSSWLTGQLSALG
ncbi:flagellar filament capping protein FliD [Dermatobacter hominis]|uniref:flagellar filament capping protein FliD n=1 Tax=Dermatobacter hominis TaxID=2884263 RepID=UPI001D1213B3|nr:flagellar filament capping protein FliD [Dermatobacter hominis]UDY37173.1 flagellar filament capping protein FliD [Dermatobacter hominis]